MLDDEKLFSDSKSEASSEEPDVSDLKEVLEKGRLLNVDISKRKGRRSDFWNQ